MIQWVMKMVCVNRGQFWLEGCRVIGDDICGFGIVLDQLRRSIGRALYVGCVGGHGGLLKLKGKDLSHPMEIHIS
jgi:hypothetical protein